MTLDAVTLRDLEVLKKDPVPRCAAVVKFANIAYRGDKRMLNEIS